MKRSFFLLNWLLFSMAFPSGAQVVNILLTPKPEIPWVEFDDVVIFHAGYSFLYNEEHEQASWVAYELTREETNNRFKRSNRFKPDPWVSTRTANNADYKRSGYDRGHLAPAADRRWSSTAMAESFYYSNMSPQLHGFNAGIWKKLEELVRTWAIEHEGILVVTGPVLKKGLKTIGVNRVSVPETYYKVILDNRDPGIKGIAFLLPHASYSGSLQSFVVPIDSVESVTGIDFFPGFPNEDCLEKTSCVEQWSWSGTSTTPKAQVRTSNQGSKVPGPSIASSNIQPQVLKAAGSMQCRGVTKAGNRCKNKTLNAGGYCHLHEGQGK